LWCSLQVDDEEEQGPQTLFEEEGEEDMDVDVPAQREGDGIDGQVGDLPSAEGDASPHHSILLGTNGSAPVFRNSSSWLRLADLSNFLLIVHPVLFKFAKLKVQETFGKRQSRSLSQLARSLSWMMEYNLLSK
jgi:hypothetical protein